MDLSRYIAKRMRAEHITQAQMARALGVTQGDVSRRLSGAYRWQLSDIREAAALFGVAAYELIRDAEATDEDEE